MQEEEDEDGGGVSTDRDIDRGREEGGVILGTKSVFLIQRNQEIFHVATASRCACDKTE